MKFCLIILALVCTAVLAKQEGEQCFEKGTYDKKMMEKKKARFPNIQKVCTAEDPEMEGEELEECARDKVEEMKLVCQEELANATDKELRDCAVAKLCPSDYEKLKSELIEITLSDRLKEVEDVITACNSEENGSECVVDRLRPLCSEIKKKKKEKKPKKEKKEKKSKKDKSG